MPAELTGYADRFSVAAGETIRFMVSTDLPNYQADIVRLIHADNNPAGPGFKEEVIGTPVSRAYPGRKQIAHSGSYVRVENSAPLADLQSLTVQAWIYPTTAGNGKFQGILSKWSQDRSAGFALVIGENGELAFWLGDGSGQVERHSSGSALRSHQWYFVAASYAPDRADVVLYHIPLSDWPLEDSSATLVLDARTRQITANDAPLLVAAAFVDQDGAVGGPFNGKIDRPRLFSRGLGHAEIEALRAGTAPETIDNLVAAWDFAADIMSSKVTDSGPYKLHGKAINMPMRAVTGYNWTATEFDFKVAPQQYGAITFHEDDLEDARWAPSFEWTLPDGLRSGLYAARLRAGDQVDHIPFVVRPRRGTATGRAAFLLPTMTYLAYANDRMRSFDEHAAGITSRKIEKDPLDLYLAEHPEFAASIYDIHTDHSGYCYSSRLRPIVSLRPTYRSWVTGAPRHLAADLYTIDWLENKGFDYDVLTDEDLHFEGEALLGQYKAVITGSHPEYWTTPMLTALESYLSHGGRLMYLGGNGFYWVTSVDPERPHIIEVRRGIGGTRAWNSAPGEAYHSTTGEMGGLWRHRGIAPNRIAGIGFTAQGWNGQAPGYTRQAGSFDPRAAFIFEGIGADEVIGNFGLVLGGAAGDELDRMDALLGTPPHALLLARSSGHDRFVLPCIEDVTEISGGLIKGQISTIHADMVYFETPNNGAVFSVGSISWSGSLSHNRYDNNVSRVTENVLRQFIQAE
jgi:N,N-dimethylformamidase